MPRARKRRRCGYPAAMSAPGGTAAPARRHRIAHGPLDLALTTFPLRQGTADPTIRVRDGTVIRALRTAEGPATLCMHVDGTDLVSTAVGPGAEAALDLAPRLAGLDDDPAALRPLHSAVAEARRRLAGLRLTAGTRMSDALTWLVLAQKVVGADARRAFRDLVRAVAEPAPGDGGLLLPPDPARLAALPSWEYHRCNVEQRRAAVVAGLARRARSLDALGELPAAEARRRLESLPGVGPWTAAEVTAVTHGDPDAVPLGDFHIPNVIAFALAGEARGDDARMLALLAPYAGQRGRVIRLLMSGGRGAPRFGPRLARRNISAL